MSIILNTNSYNSLEELEEYMLGRLNSSSWDNATDTEKEKAARTATREIDEQDIIGSKYDSLQVLQFPRSFDENGILSNDIKNCHAEWTLELLEEDYNLKKELNNGITSKSIDNVQISFGGNKREININEPKRVALRYIKKYLYASTATIR